MLPRSKRFACATLCGFLFACAAQPAALVPPKIGPPRARPDRYGGGIKIGKVSVIAQGAVRPADAQQLRDALVARLEAAFPRRDPKLPPVAAAIRYEAGYSTEVTGILDAFAVLTLGLWPLTPRWGYTRGEMHIALRTPPELGAQPPALGRVVYLSEGYSIALYSWFRTAPIERAFEATHGDAFRWAVRTIDQWWPERSAVRYPYPVDYERPSREGAVRFDFDADGQLEAVYGHTGWHLIRDDSLYDLPAQEGRVSRTAALAGRRRGFWRQYVGALSGLEAGYFTGTAAVSSEAFNTRSGETFTIASGSASSRGWKISLYNPPTSSELFIYPTAGFFSLDIDIADVAGDVPLGNVAGARDVRAVATDPNTGEPVDLGAPNVYSLKLRSGYVGQRLGGSAVWGTQRTQLYLAGEGGVNLFEVRHTNVRLGDKEAAGFSANFLHSFAARGLFGLVYRPWHVGARCELNYELYREFGFPQAIPFEGPVEYDAELKTYQRRDMKVDAALVHTANFFCGLGFVY